MNTDLSSLLTNVWENRHEILSLPAVAVDDETIEDRVYAFYAPNNPISSTPRITKETYLSQLQSIISPLGKMKWRKNIRGGFHVWDAGGRLSGTVNYRLYLNAKPECAVAVLKKIMVLASVDDFGMPTSSPNLSQLPAIRNGLVARAQRLSQFGEGIAAAKIADENEAFTDRPDKIVVYANEYGGEPIASILAQKLSRDIHSYNSNIPPMTRRIAMGVSIGAEVADFAIGTSFGEVRCNLIARALLQTMTGKSPADVPETHRILHPSGKFNQTKVPITPKPFSVTGNQNRLDFVALVETLFRNHGINPQAPWQ